MSFWSKGAPGGAFTCKFHEFAITDKKNPSKKKEHFVQNRPKWSAVGIIQMDQPFQSNLLKSDTPLTFGNPKITAQTRVCDRTVFI